MRYLFIWLVRIYRAVFSPIWHALMGPQAGCRFTPTCSEYAIEALRVHGTFRGLGLALKRVSRCHPGCCGGEDSVPPKKTSTDCKK